MKNLTCQLKRERHISGERFVDSRRHWTPLEHLFSSVIEGLSLHIDLLLKLGELLKEGTLVLGDTLIRRVRSTITTKEFLLMSLLSSDL